MPAQNPRGSLDKVSSNEITNKRTINKSKNKIDTDNVGIKIVAIGASSGGLKACVDLFDNLEMPKNMAFILVQHLEPSRESLLCSLLKDHTDLIVNIAEDGMMIAPGNLYIIPAGAYLTIENGHFNIDTPMIDTKTGSIQIRMPFDKLLFSMAKNNCINSIAIVLSGTGNDGTLGIQAVKEKGAIIIAQSPQDAQNDGMPNSAIATKIVDKICNAAQMGEYLNSLAWEVIAEPNLQLAPQTKEYYLNEIIDLIKFHNAHDFTQYKPGTIHRRIERRMSMLGFTETLEYFEFLKIDADEREKLVNDLLINVTSFFRDEDVYNDLEANVIAQIVRDFPANKCIRIWVAGCSTGEEAYSLAILFIEAIEAQKKKIKLQIFASDLDAQAISLAREGQFTNIVKSQINPARLKKFFKSDGHGYRVIPQLRAQIIFTVHNVLSDPPFSNIDFVSCRNLLIYLTPIAQAKIIARFHFALKDEGLLLLGKSETAGHINGRFEIISKPYRLYQRIGKRVWNDTNLSRIEPEVNLKVYEDKNGLRAKNHLRDIEQELEDTRVQLLGAMNNLELSDEVQKTINEEALSVSEEFQSANEELITSKEELQALNEELNALNSQLQEALDIQRILSTDLQNVLFSTDIATLFLDKDLCIRFFTPSTRAIFNIINSDIGRPLFDLNSLASDPSLPKDLNCVLNGDLKHEREVKTLDGKWYLRRVLPYLSDKTTIEGVVITFGDITERKNISKALEEARLEADRANIAKSRFLAVASHDLRQPLQSLALLQGLLANLVNSPEGNHIVTRLNETLDAITAMLNSLLDLNQIESGLVQVTKSDFCIDDLLRRLFNEFSFHAKAQNLELHYVTCRKIVWSDMRLLEQMVRNLISNAFKYTPNGKVLLGCRKHDDVLKIEILDTGIGIGSENLESIFEAYNQVGNPSKARNQGLGLGLSIVQRLGQLLSLKVDVSSKLYRGSVFSIEVPLAKSPSSLVNSKKETIEKIGKINLKIAENQTIVIIEDDCDVRELLMELLDKQGFSSVSFKNGLDALDWLEKAKIIPNLILADYNLSHELNGVETSIRIRKFCKTHIPSIILTGDTSSETLNNVVSNDCLQLNKPVKMPSLIKLINNQLGVSREEIITKTQNEDYNNKTVLSSKPQWVYVIDDDLNIRTTISETFEAKGYSVKVFANAESFLQSDYNENASCILIDAYLPDMNGIELLRELNVLNISIPKIVITGNADVTMSVNAMKAGAIDFLEKPIKSDDLIKCVENSIEVFQDANKLLIRQNEALSIVSNLTPRQNEIMHAVLAGKPSKIIAYELGISQRTVENHRALIMKKTGAKSLPALARLALVAQKQP